MHRSSERGSQLGQITYRAVQSVYLSHSSVLAAVLPRRTRQQLRSARVAVWQVGRPCTCRFKALPLPEAHRMWQGNAGEGGGPRGEAGQHMPHKACPQAAAMEGGQQAEVVHKEVGALAGWRQRRQSVVEWRRGGGVGHGMDQQVANDMGVGAGRPLHRHKRAAVAQDGLEHVVLLPQLGGIGCVLDALKCRTVRQAGRQECDVPVLLLVLLPLLVVGGLGWLACSWLRGPAAAGEGVRSSGWRLLELLLPPLHWLLLMLHHAAVRVAADGRMHHLSSLTVPAAKVCSSLLSFCPQRTSNRRCCDGRSNSSRVARIGPAAAAAARHQSCSGQVMALSISAA